jgi:hypothetical protein
MSTIFVTISKRAIEDMKRRVREAADRGSMEGIVDGPCRLSVLKLFLAKPKVNRRARRRPTDSLRKPS